MKNSYWKIIFIFLIFGALFFTCTDINEDIRQNTGRLRSQRDSYSQGIRTTNRGRYEVGSYNPGNYSGEICRDADDREQEECEDKCERMFNRDSSKCEVLPVDLIAELDTLFSQLERIQSVRDGNESLFRTVDEYNFGVLLDISITPALELLKQWAERETKEFLIWTAENEQIALSLREYDRNNEILRRAFGKISRSTNYTKVIQQGLAVDLAGFGDTFLSLAEQTRNKSAFVIADSLLQKVCGNNENCQLQAYCVSIANERSASRRNPCTYLRGSRFRSSRDDYCYVQGPNVWSYWTFLRQDKEIVNTSFNDNFEIDDEVCDDACGSNSQHCLRDS